MPKLESLGSKQRKMLEGWPCPEFAETPWTAMNKPLSDCKVALVTNAGYMSEVTNHLFQPREVGTLLIV